MDLTMPFSGSPATLKASFKYESQGLYHHELGVAFGEVIWFSFGFGLLCLFACGWRTCAFGEEHVDIFLFTIGPTLIV